MAHLERKHKLFCCHASCARRVAITKASSWCSAELSAPRCMWQCVGKETWKLLITHESITSNILKLEHHRGLFSLRLALCGESSPADLRCCHRILNLQGHEPSDPVRPLVFYIAWLVPQFSTLAKALKAQMALPVSPTTVQTLHKTQRREGVQGHDKECIWKSEQGCEAAKLLPAQRCCPQHGLMIYQLLGSQPGVRLACCTKASTEDGRVGVESLQAPKARFH